MNYLFESGSTFSRTVIVLGIVGCLSIYGIYLSQKIINENEAERIIHAVWNQAQKTKELLEPKDIALDEEEDLYYENEKGLEAYSFKALEDSTPDLVKIETAKKAIPSGVCKAMEIKLAEAEWRDVFEKVLVVDRQGNEKTNILMYNCPNEKVPSLRFYVSFVKPVENKEEVEEEESVAAPEESDEDVYVPNFPSAPSGPTPLSKPTVVLPVKTPSSTSSVSSRQKCPVGTSAYGRGAIATANCRCIGADEAWNGSTCVAPSCPAGSSKNVSDSGDKAGASGCYCKDETPVWNGNICESKCPDNKVRVNGECIVPKTSSDCRWGICQTCEEDGTRYNLYSHENCEVGGLRGVCNDNGTCYPTEGRRCSSARGCPSGQFCNYGGNLNSSNKQNGKFGQTANVCQAVNPQKFTYKKVTYYYNTEQDLKAWCRAANNKPNCKWGYLAKSGAESWCFSLGKRLLTRQEMAEVWDVLKEKLPQTYTGYAYWVQEGAWLESKKGKLSFGRKNTDGYGGRGGVVCR